VGCEGALRWGVGVDESIITASLRAVLSAMGGLDRRHQGA
jgi:hypothetical protein